MTEQQRTPIRRGWWHCTKCDRIWSHSGPAVTYPLEFPQTCTRCGAAMSFVGYGVEGRIKARELKRDGNGHTREEKQLEADIAKADLYIRQLMDRAGQCAERIVTKSGRREFWRQLESRVRTAGKR